MTKEERREYMRIYRIKNCEELKAQDRARYHEHREEVAARRKWYREANKKRIAARQKQYRKANKKRIAAQKKQYYEANPQKSVVRNHRRRAAKRNATPRWDTDVDQHVERLALKRTPDLHIDHIVPLTGKTHTRHHVQLVCGLHIADNLELISATRNLSKNCREWPDMWDYTPSHMTELEAMHAAQQPVSLCMKHYV